MNTIKQILSLSAAALCAGALAPAVAPADSVVERGRYSGKTSQPAAGGEQPFTGKVTVALGRFSDPARVTRVELTARLRCDDGTTRDARYAKVIAFGPKLKANGAFEHRDGGLVMTGRFNRAGKARGSFTYTLETCSVTGATWSAAQR
jgi:hypothetical protein